MQKTIGGDRIGSGKKMTFNTKDFGRSTHNLSETFRSTMSAGTLVPFVVIPTLPGDTLDIRLDCDIRTLPTIGPLFGSYKVQLDVYQIPVRLYMRDLQMNKQAIGKDMSQVLFPKMIIQSNTIELGLQYPQSKDQPWGGKEINNCQIEPSTILSYLGIKGIGNQPDITKQLVGRSFNAIPWLMYWDIYKQYYANKMEEKGYYIHNPMTTQDSLIQRIDIVTNDGITDIPVNTPTLVTTGEQFTMILTFETYDNYGQFLAEEMVLTATRTTPAPRDYRWKGTEDWEIQYNDSQLKIYYNLKTTWNDGLETDLTLTGFSDISYDFIKPNVTTFALENIDIMRETIMTQAGTSPLILDASGGLDAPYSSIFEGRFVEDLTAYNITALQCKQEGLGLKTYQSDVNNNWLNTEWITGENGVNDVTSIQVDADGKFTLDEFNIKKKVYDMLNHIVASGGSYDDWQDTLWGVQRIKQIASPVYEGGLSKELVFEEVISNSGSDEGQPLGTLAGRGVMNGKHKGGNLIIKTSEPSYVIGIVSITPRIDYSSGNEWHTNLTNMGEWHNPYLDAIGYQDLITDTLAYWDTDLDATGQPVYKSAGKQPSWINYQTSKNKVFGNFALQNEQMFMTLNRRYEVDYIPAEGYSIGDVTTYIDPKKFNHIFADTSPDAMNFWVQISSEIEGRRVMSANQIPNL